MGVWLLTWTAEAAVPNAACLQSEDRSSLLTRLEAAALEGRISDAEHLKEQILSALACGPLAQRDWLARWWLGEAVIASLLGDERPTEDALVASVRLAPEVWVESYGTSFRLRHEQIAADIRAGSERYESTGRIVIETQVEGWRDPDKDILIALDGTPAAGPVLEVPSGYHLLQIGFDPLDIRYARLIYVVSEQDLVVRALVPGDSQPEVPLTTVPLLPPVHKRVPAWGISGGALGLASTTTALLALDRNNAMRAASTREQLDMAYQTQRAYGTVSYALLGGSIVSLSLEIVLTIRHELIK